MILMTVWWSCLRNKSLRPAPQFEDYIVSCFYCLDNRAVHSLPAYTHIPDTSCTLNTDPAFKMITAITRTALPRTTLRTSLATMSTIRAKHTLPPLPYAYDVCTMSTIQRRVQLIHLGLRRWSLPSLLKL